jgi:hypothetical protein
MFQKIDIKFFFFLALLFLFYFNHISKVYLHGDVIIYLTDTKDGYHSHSQFHWLVSLGRFIAAYFDYYVLFKNINILEDFNYFRFYAYLIILINYIILYKILKKHFSDPIFINLICFFFFTLPVFSFHVMSVGFSNLLSISFGLLCFFIKDKVYLKSKYVSIIDIFFLKKISPLFFLLNVFFFIIIAGLYPTGFAIYFALFILDLFKEEKYRNIYLRILKNFYILIISIIIYFLSIKIFFKTIPVNLSSYSINIDLVQVLYKIYNSFSTIIPGSLQFSFINLDYNILIWIILIISSFLYINKFSFHKFFLFIIFLILTTFPFTLSNFALINLNRLNFPISAILIFFIIISFYKLKKILYFKIILAIIVSLLTIKAYHYNRAAIKDAQVELNYIINQINNYEHEIKHINLFYPVERKFSPILINGLEKYKTYYDEFFISYFYREQFIYQFMSLALKNTHKYSNKIIYECDPRLIDCMNSAPENSIIFSKTNKLTDICILDNTLFINMSHLNKNISTNDELQKKNCNKNSITISINKDPYKMGASYAFDDRVDENSFYETFLDSNESGILNFNFPLNLDKFSYEIKTSNHIERLPVIWEIYFFDHDEKEWKFLKTVNFNSWKKNFSEKFDVVNLKKSSLYRIFFKKTNMPDNLMRIYEINVLY